MTVSYYLLGGRFAFLAEQNPLVMVGGVILAGIGIFVVCALIDWIRELLFRKLRIKDRLSRIKKVIDIIRLFYYIRYIVRRGQVNVGNQAPDLASLGGQ